MEISFKSIDGSAINSTARQSIAPVNSSITGYKFPEIKSVLYLLSLKILLECPLLPPVSNLSDIDEILHVYIKLRVFTSTVQNFTKLVIKQQKLM